MGTRAHGKRTAPEDQTPATGSALKAVTNEQLDRVASLIASHMGERGEAASHDHAAILARIEQKLDVIIAKLPC